MKYELLLFDADDTLFDYSKGEEYALRKTLKQFSVDENFLRIREFYKTINSTVWKEFEQGEISADNLKVERFARLFSELGIETDAAGFSDSYLNNLSEATFLIDGAEEIVKELYGKSKMAIITNGLTKVQRPRFDRSSIGKYFDEYIVSEEIGLQKPSPEIFEYAFNKLEHSDKTSALMIGDNPGSDILGGCNFGIDTCWYNSKGGESAETIHSTYTITDIRELKNIIYPG